MTNAELITALRYCGNFEDREGCDEECPYFNDKDCPKRIMIDAADAIETAEKRIAELEAQLPKDGEWIETEMGFNSYAWVCSACEEPWVLNAGTPSENDMNYCPNCGARMKTVTNCHTLEEGERKEKKNEKDSDTI